nr:hypothetical protein [Frankia sp. BMG5.23]
MCRHGGSERLVEVVSGHHSPGVDLIKVQPREDGLVEHLPCPEPRPPVQRLRIFQEAKHGGQHLVALIEGKILLAQPGLDPGAFLPDGPHLGRQLVLGPVRVTYEVEQTVFPLVQLLELPFVLGVQPAGTVRGAGQGVVEAGLDVGPELLGESDIDVVPHDGVFDVRYGQVRQVTGAVLPSPADVVEVRHAGLALARRDDQPLVASVTPDEPFQIVVVDTLPCPGLPFGEQHPLYLVEQILRDQRLVPALVLLTLVGDEAEVVAVLQQITDLVHRDRPGAPALGRLGA